ncbi:hypothetical protein [Sphingomonas sp. G-3-2-10]|uniref:hypothetical protein n=1 Tax=Sphingomonas sp. G-3-2-10 TaxID=2728838 RepID=UPI00146BB6B4|nr:hypothetical protein [Sphingomonas sp. G-3-2-10]NML06795.1 hypothetical protein [Sphingomonas sp. G-3-2-10]
MIFETRERHHVANCPKCDTPHRYTELKFPMINDRGSWLVACRKCGQHFVFDLRNPAESYSDDCMIVERFDNDINPYAGNAPRPGASAVYQLDMNPDQPRFDLDAFPIFKCAKSGESLEAAAFLAIGKSWLRVADARAQATNQMLARSRLPPVEHVVFFVEVPCSCGEPHRAIFYHPLRLDGSDLPPVEELLLADVSGTDLADVLTGILSKTDVMHALGKLIARWRLFNDQILLATPFVAHQWKTKAERLAIWETLLAQLDPTRTILMTRGATLKEYRDALLESGLDHVMLSRFGLENRIVGDGKRKQDSHAKVYIGLGETCEVLSGSANVVQGDSMENVTFQALGRNKVETSYLAPLGVSLPEPRPRLSHHLLIECRDGVWRWDLAAGAAPKP